MDQSTEAPTSNSKTRYRHLPKMALSWPHPQPSNSCSPVASSFIINGLMEWASAKGQINGWFLCLGYTGLSYSTRFQHPFRGLHPNPQKSQAFLSPCSPGRRTPKEGLRPGPDRRILRVCFLKNDPRIMGWKDTGGDVSAICIYIYI